MLRNKLGLKTMGVSLFQEKEVTVLLTSVICEEALLSLELKPNL